MLAIEALHLGRPIAVQVRIEARREQLGELAGQGRVGGQGLLHVGLAVRAADLEQVLAAGAQHRDLAPVEPGAEHELVEAVVLRIAAPDAGERVLEIAPDLVDVDLAGLGALHREVVHREAAAVLGHEAVRPLVDDPQAHVLEHRQDVGQGNARAGAAELEADQGVVVLERAIERHLEIALAPGDPVDAGEVGDRGARRHLLLIARAGSRRNRRDRAGCPPPRHGRRSARGAAGRSRSAWPRAAGARAPADRRPARCRRACAR